MTSDGRLRLLPWMRRHPFRLACAVCAALALAGTWVLWQQKETLEEELAAHAQEGETMMSTLANGVALRPELAYVRTYTKRIEDHLVMEDNLADNKSYFYQLEEQTHVRLSDVQQRPTAPPETDALYKHIPFSLRLTGTYPQVAAFLHAVETGPRMGNVTSFSFHRNPPPAQTVTLDLSLEFLGKL